MVRGPMDGSVDTRKERYDLWLVESVDMELQIWRNHRYRGLAINDMGFSTVRKVSAPNLCSSSRVNCISMVNEKSLGGRKRFVILLSYR